jgi:hypothetical protein
MAHQFSFSAWRRSQMRSEATLVVACALSTFATGCTEAAGLQDHLPFLGFPDSRSDVLCAPNDPEASNRVPCNSDGVTSLQDGHVQIWRPEYFEEGVNIRDSITELVWRKKTSVVDNYEEAADYCEKLDGDYRLPSRLELISLLDYGGSSILLDPLFEGRQPIRYRSSTDYWPESPQFAITHWGVNFDGAMPPLMPSGSTHFPGETHQLHDSNEAGVVCVRNDSRPFAAGPFVPSGNENRFLLDQRTKLMWLKEPIDVDSWQEALTECRDLPDGGYGDFRLPNIKELATIINDETTIDLSARPHEEFDFPMTMPYLLSSTPTPDARYVYALSTDGGSVGRVERTINYYHALCVRGPY